MEVTTNQIEDISKGTENNIFRTLIEESPMPVALYSGAEMTIQTANEAILKAWNKDKSVIGKPLLEVLPELAGQSVHEILREVFTTGVAYHSSNSAVDFEVDGETRTSYFNFTYKPLKDAKGKVVGILNTATDITDQVLANKILQASETNFRNLIMQAPVGMMIMRGRELIVEVANDSYLEMAGRKHDEMVGKPLWDGLPEARNQGFQDILMNVLDTGTPFYSTEHPVSIYRGGKKQVVYVNFVYQPLAEPDGKVKRIICIVIEVTGHVLARQKLEKSESALLEANQRLEMALEAGNLGLFELDISSGAVQSNAQHRMNLGIPVDATITYSDVLNAILPSYREYVEKQITDAIRNKSTYQAEYEIQTPDGSVKWIKASGKALYDETGKAVALTGVSINITEQKLLQQQKDDFIGIASHELKTPLTSLKASMQILNRMIVKEPVSEKIPALFNQSTISLGKLERLLSDLLNVTKIKEGQLALNKTVFTISKIVDDCCHHVRMVGKHELIVQGDQELKACADSQRIDQVLVNLVNNAVKYAPNSRNIYIRIEETNGFAKVSVTDNGPGISPERIPHLFDRYYRVDREGIQTSGLGLGLYISADIVRRHGGKIGVDSTQGHGSTFWFTIPLG